MARGRAVAALLAGAWRADPPRPRISPAALEAIRPILLAGGAGPLGWHALRGAPAGTAPAAAGLRAAYYAETLHSLRQQSDLHALMQALQAAGIDPLLFKGWAVARHYPRQGLRPYGDFDLLVRPEEEAAARRVLDEMPALRGAVDLKTALEDLPGRDAAEIRAHAMPLPLGSVRVRVIGPEDHLRLLCFHYLRHGGYRPIWLCDIAALLETLPESFDWRYFLAGSASQAAWLLAMIDLAHRLLGAAIPPGAPPIPRAPRWLLTDTLRRWGAPAETGIGPPLVAIFTVPGSLRGWVLLRWRHPIYAALCLGLPPLPVPPALLQAACFVWQGSAWAARTLRAPRRNWALVREYQRKMLR